MARRTAWHLDRRGRSPAILSGVRGGALVADAVGAVVAIALAGAPRAADRRDSVSLALLTTPAESLRVQPARCP